MKALARGRFWALAGILLAGAALRMWHLPDLPPGLFYDEAINGVDIRMILGGHGLPLFFTANNGREPLFIYLQALSVALLGYRAFALRFVPALIGILTIPAVYFCARAFFDLDHHSGEDEAKSLAVWSALLAAGTLAVSYWPLSLSRLGLRAVMLPLVSALAMACFWRAWKTGRRRTYTWAGLWFGLALYTYTAAPVLLLAPALFLLGEVTLALWQWRRVDDRPALAALWRPRLAGLALACGLLAAIAAPLVVAVWQDATWPAGRAGQVSILAPSPEAISGRTPAQRLAANVVLVVRNFYDQGDQDRRHNLPGRPANDPLLAALFTAGWLALFWRSREPRAARARLLLIWFGVMLLPSLLSGEAPHSLRAAGAIPPLALICATGGQALLARLPQQARGRAGQAALLGTVLLVSGSLTARDYFLRWARLPGLGDTFDVGLQLGAEETARQLAEIGPGEAVLVSQQLFEQPQMAFAVGVLPGDARVPAAAEARATRFVVEQPFDPDQPMYLLYRNGPVLAAAPLAPLAADGLAAIQTLAAQREPAPVRTASAPVQAADRPAAWPRVLAGPLPAGIECRSRVPAVPLDVTFAGGLRLTGYDMQPAEAVAGRDQVRLTLYWQWDAASDHRALAAGDVFVNMASATGVWQTANHPLPADYLLAWPGSARVAADERLIGVPPLLPPGRAYFEVGFYRPAGGPAARVPILDGQGRPAADQVRLGAFMVNGRPPQAALDDLLPLAARLGDSLELAGWRATTDPAQPGVLRVELGWRALGRVPSDYTAFVHLIDGSGQIIAQHDEAPAGTADPTSLWVPGETVRAAFSLPLPSGIPLAGLRLRVGLYEPVSARQLPVTLPAGSGPEGASSTYLLLPLDRP